MKRAIGACITIVVLILFIVWPLILEHRQPLAKDVDQVSPEDKIVIRFSHVTGENTPKGLAAEKFARLVKERTNGRVEVQVFANSSLYSDGEELDKLASNNIQMIATATSKITRLVPEWSLFDLPYLFEKPEDVWRVADGPIGQKLFAKLRDHNLVPLAMWDNGFKEITNNTHPILNPSDFRGLHFRVMSNGVLQSQFENVDATATVLPFDEVYQALEKSHVNAEENTISNIYSKRFYQVQKYVTISNHGYLGYVVLTNQSFWNSLPSDIRQTLADTMLEVTAWERKDAIEINKRNLDELRKNDQIVINDLSSEQIRQWKKALSPTYDWFRENIDSMMLDQVRGPAPD